MRGLGVCTVVRFTFLSFLFRVFLLLVPGFHLTFCDCVFGRLGLHDAHDIVYHPVLPCFMSTRGA